MGGFGQQLWGGQGPAAGAVSVTGIGLIYGALRLLGVLRPGSSAATAANEDGLAWLNELLDSWATERLMVKVIARSAAIALDGSAIYYTAGLPHRIEGAGYMASGDVTERPLRVYTPEEWRAISQKTLTGEPAGVYPEYGATEVTLRPWPVPASGDLYVYQWEPLTAFADLSTEYALPPGYAAALRYALADDLAESMEIIAKIPISQVKLARIAGKAREYKGKIKSLNCRAQLMVNDAPGTFSGGSYDIRTGEYL